MTWLRVDHMKKNHKIPALAKAVRKGRAARQQEAAAALAHIGDGEATRALLELAQCDDINVWQTAQKALMTITNSAAVPALCDALASGNYAVTKPVLSALIGMEGDMAFGGLLKALEDERLAPDVLVALRGRNRPEMVEPLENLLMRMTEKEAAASKTRLWQQAMCRDVVTLLTEVEDISTVKALHTFIRERENAPWRLRTQAAHALAAKGLAGEQALAGYVGEAFMDVQRVMLLIECMPNPELCDILFEVMPPRSADEFGTALMACLNRMQPEVWPHIVTLLERLDRDNARSALLLWFVQSKAASVDAAYTLARHGNTRPVLVKRLVDMVRFEEQEIRLRAGTLLHKLYADKLITQEGVFLIQAHCDEEENIIDYEYIGYKD